ncbi:MAG: DinB family protein [Phycisphaeraceae bacterium]|nr:MAG: DinB family protein [Phycisphaeraceae bacterium]
MDQTTTGIDILLGLFDLSQGQLREAYADIPDDRMADAFPGIVNHPAWTLTHLIAAAGGIAAVLGDPAPGSSPDELARFGPGSKPVADRSAYEPKVALLERLASRHAHAARVVRERHAERFPLPPPPPFTNFAPTAGNIASYLLACHEPYHLGQLMVWRRAAGLGKA